MEPEEQRERDRQVRRVILIEGAANIAVLSLKTGIGLWTGSMAILGDALHSLTDVANNVVAWFVIRISAQPPDAEHPYGHRKFETVAVFGLAMLLVVLAFELALRAVQRGEPSVVSSPFLLVLMLGGLAVNATLAAWERRRAKQLDSDILEADARHTFSDALTTLVVIAGWQAAAYGYQWFDTVAALGVAGLILTLAYGLFRRSIPILVDQRFVEPGTLVDAAIGVPGVVGVRRARSRGHGEQAAVDIAIFVEPEIDTVAAHEIATAVERSLRRELGVATVTVHVEPARRHGHADDDAIPG